MAKANNEKVGFPELHTQLRILNRLMAAQLKATVGQQGLVRLLSGSGASNAEIADVLDTTAATVATTLQRLKRRLRPAATPGGSVEVGGMDGIGGTDD